MLNVGRGLWFGVGIRSWQPLQRTGRCPLDVRLMSFDDADRTARVCVNGWRLDEGPGLAIDAVLIIASSLPDPASLHGHLIGWIDVEASLGQRWPIVSRVVTRLEPGARLARLARRTNGSATREKIGVVRVSEWARLRVLVKNAAEAIGMELEASLPQVRAVAIPGAGLGLDTSLAVGIGRVTAQTRDSGDAPVAAAS